VGPYRRIISGGRLSTLSRDTAKENGKNHYRWSDDAKKRQPDTEKKSDYPTEKEGTVKDFSSRKRIETPEKLS